MFSGSQDKDFLTPIGMQLNLTIYSTYSSNLEDHHKLWNCLSKWVCEYIKLSHRPKHLQKRPEMFSFFNSSNLCANVSWIMLCGCDRSQLSFSGKVIGSQWSVVLVRFDFTYCWMCHTILKMMLSDFCENFMASLRSKTVNPSFAYWWMGSLKNDSFPFLHPGIMSSHLIRYRKVFIFSFAHLGLIYFTVLLSYVAIFMKFFHWFLSQYVCHLYRERLLPFVPAFVSCGFAKCVYYPWCLHLESLGSFLYSLVSFVNKTCFTLYPGSGVQFVSFTSLIALYKFKDFPEEVVWECV